jgi:methionyl-tRNA formyltransferase
LRRLIESPHHEVAAVVTRPDAAAGRGKRQTRSPIGRLADEHGIEVLTPVKPSDPDFVERLTQIAPDACPVVAYGALIPQQVLTIPKLGWLNLHFSLLPAWRGAAPVQAAIAAGDEVTGATVFHLDPGLDTGPVYGVVTERIDPTDTAGDLLGRLARSGAVLLERVLTALSQDAIHAIPQSADGVSHAPKMTVASARVDWTAPAFVIHRQVRAATPNPGAWTEIGGVRVKLGPVHPIAAETAAPDHDLAPGELWVGKREVLVGTATNPLRLGTVQPPGKKPMAAEDWARGARLGSEVRAQ